MAEPSTVQLLVGNVTFVAASTMKLIGAALVKLNWNNPPCSVEEETKIGDAGGVVTNAMRDAVATPPNAFVTV